MKGSFVVMGEYFNCGKNLMEKIYSFQNLSVVLIGRPPKMTCISR